MLKANGLIHRTVPRLIYKMDQTVIIKIGQILLPLHIFGVHLLCITVIASPLRRFKASRDAVTHHTLIYLGKDDITFHRRMEACNQITVMLSGFLLQRCSMHFL